VSDLGFCALDRSRTPRDSEEVLACWQPEDTSAEPAPGLFDALEPAPGRPGRHRREVADQESEGHHAEQSVTARSTGQARVAPRLGSGRLVDAPVVAPGRRIMSEAKRRALLRRAGDPADPW
jgi:hypothetical protein